MTAPQSDGGGLSNAELSDAILQAGARLNNSGPATDLYNATRKHHAALLAEQAKRATAAPAQAWEAATVTPEMVREALAHIPFEVSEQRNANQKWEWLAKFLTNALANPNEMCPCCNVTPAGDVLDHLPIAEQHSDDTAVDAFAAAMKAKLAEARAKGRRGWNDTSDPEMHGHLCRLLRGHVEKGDPRDVANFCMFLHQRGEAILPAAAPAQSAQGECQAESDACTRDAEMLGTGVMVDGHRIDPERVRIYTAPQAASNAEELALDAFIAEIRAELSRARTKFPGNRVVTVAMAEEFGEVCKAVLDESPERVRAEAAQLAAMACRLVLDGDSSVAAWRAEHKLARLGCGA